MNITLIGMPGAGKSFVGRKLAERLGYTFVELDTLLETEVGLPLQQIIGLWGEERFLERQAQDAISYTHDQNDMVVSTGGSIVYTESAMEHLRRISTILYLDVPLSVLEGRIKSAPPRGIIGLGANTIAELYAERVVLYKRWADTVVDAAQEGEKVISEIIQGTMSDHTL